MRELIQYVEGAKLYELLLLVVIAIIALLVVFVASGTVIILALIKRKSIPENEQRERNQ